MNQSQSQQHSQNIISISELKAKMDSAEQARKDMHDDVKRLFVKLDEINSRLSVMEASPKCSDPSACTRVEVNLADQNRRLMKLELQRQYSMGERSAIGIICVAIGTLVGWVLSWMHK